MTDTRLIGYIRLQLSKGFSVEQIRQKLASIGWQDYQIKTATDAALMQQITGTTPTLNNQQDPVKKSYNLQVMLFSGVALIAGGISMLIILIIR